MFLKSYFVAKETFNEVDEFCWQLRDGINEMVENHVKFDCVSNLSKKERTALIKLIAEKNKSRSSMTRIKTGGQQMRTNVT